MKRERPIRSIFVLITVCCLAFSIASANSFDHIKNQVKEHTLTNGMKFIVLERHDAPVVSFHVYADVGSANEVYGITGISHLLEHMAFKGTTTVGTKDHEKEVEILKKLDTLFDQIRVQENASYPDSVKISRLKAEFETVHEAAEQLVENNEFIDMFLKEGERGINAYTNFDATQYVNALPSNKLEFWMAMTSDRFLNPVFREFYKEREVVMEERRLAVETQPLQKMLEDFLAAAFKAHPYHHHVIGHMSDLERITRRDVNDYFKKFYTPSNMVVGIVGDIQSKAVFNMAELYFGRIPSGAKPELPRTIEPEQWGERRIEVVAKSQPFLVVGFHKPNIRHSDDLVFEALSNILGEGRSSWLYEIMVKEKKIAIQTGAFNGLPGVKYANLCAFYAIPAKDHTSEECFTVIEEVIERSKTEPVSQDELQKFKRTAKKQLIDSWKSNNSMARLLTENEVLEGDWRILFDQVDSYEAITAEDIKRVANTYLIKTNRTIGEVVPEE